MLDVTVELCFDVLSVVGQLMTDLKLCKRFIHWKWCMVKPDLCDCSLKLYDYIRVKNNVRNLVKFNLIKQVLTKKKNIWISLRSAPQMRK